MKFILKDKKKQRDLDFDNVPEKIQGRNGSAEPARLSKEDVSNENSGVCGTNCVATGTSIEFNYLLQKILHAVGTNKLTTTK